MHNDVLWERVECLQVSRLFVVELPGFNGVGELQVLLTPPARFGTSLLPYLHVGNSVRTCLLLSLSLLIIHVRHLF